MTAEECKVLSGPDLVQWLNTIGTLAVGGLGAYFVLKQNRILNEQSKIFEKQNDFNNRLLAIQNRLDKKERLINRVHHGGLKDSELDEQIENLLKEGVHFSEVAGAFRALEIPTDLSTPGIKSQKKIEESFARGRAKLGMK